MDSIRDFDFSLVDSHEATILYILSVASWSKVSTLLVLAWALEGIVGLPFEWISTFWLQIISEIQQYWHYFPHFQCPLLQVLLILSSASRSGLSDHVLFLSSFFK